KNSRIPIPRFIKCGTTVKNSISLKQIILNILTTYLSLNKYRISAISYTNTKPFVYGLQHSGILEKIDMSFDVPSECARKLIADETDIGIVPAAALLQIPDYHIISDYCIGADGPVHSVFIFSEKPVEKIKTLRLDMQSRTSNNLAKILLRDYWKVQPEIIEGDADAFVEIGDRTFGKISRYPFVYDLAEAWKNHTGLPFVFAVWAANKPIHPDFISTFNAALKFGLDNLKQVIKTLPKRDDFDFSDYLEHHIQYHLDKDKREALKRFHTLIKDY